MHSIIGCILSLYVVVYRSSQFQLQSQQSQQSTLNLLDDSEDENEAGEDKDVTEVNVTEPDLDQAQQTHT